MSRTYRRKNSYEEYWYTQFYFELNPNEKKSLQYYISRYHSDACGTMNQCPSWFKKTLRQKYRSQCKQLLKNIKWDEIEFPKSRKNALWEWW